MACDIPEPCEFPSIFSCQKRFLRTHEESDLAPHPVVGLALQVGDAEKLPQALGLEGPDPYPRVSKQGTRALGNKRVALVKTDEKVALVTTDEKVHVISLP